MTVSASRENDNYDNVKVQITYGPVTAYVIEDRSHVRNFHEQLGRLLDQLDSEADA
jgi:hypothetical protein